MLKVVGGWKNFSMWRGRLPHWRADGVVYYATFRHRRPLTDGERGELFRHLLRIDGRKGTIRALVVGAESSTMLVTVGESMRGEPHDLTDLLTKATRQASKAITKDTGERFPPFQSEPYDRIVRDDAELEEFLGQILTLAGIEPGVEGMQDREFLWLAPEP